MTSMTAFIRARLDDWEQTARACREQSWPIVTESRSLAGRAYEDVWLQGVGMAVAASVDPATIAPWDADHIARHDPARVLAQVAAMRQLVFLHQMIVVWPDGTAGAKYYTGSKWVCRSCDERTEVPCPTLRLLAAIWSSHPDYDPAWVPEGE